MRGLIYRLSRENPLWSPERIRDTLILLQYYPPCDDTIRKYMYKPRKPHKRSTTWLPFLRNHLDVSWAIDFFTVTTINFTTLYVFMFSLFLTMVGWAESFLWDRLENRQAMLIWLSENVFVDLCSYANIPVMQTSKYRNRNEFAWAWNRWLFCLWNGRVTVKALVWPCNVIVIFDEFLEQPFQMTQTEHYHMIEHLSP